MPDIVAPKTQTTSPLVAHFQRFSPRWSAIWAPHHCKSWPRRYQAGGIATLEARHAARGLRMAQNPTATSVERAAGAGGPGWGTGGWRKPGNCTHGRCHSETNLAQQEPRRAASVQNSPSTPPRTACAVQNSPSTSRTALLPVQNSPCSPEMARFGAFSECRESFVPLSPPRSRAGRILYRTQGRDGASHDSTTGPTCVEGGGRAWSRQISHAIQKHK